MVDPPAGRWSVNFNDSDELMSILPAYVPKAIRLVRSLIDADPDQVQEAVADLATDTAESVRAFGVLIFATLALTPVEGDFFDLVKAEDNFLDSAIGSLVVAMADGEPQTIADIVERVAPYGEGVILAGARSVRHAAKDDLDQLVHALQLLGLGFAMGTE